MLLKNNAMRETLIILMVDRVPRCLWDANILPNVQPIYINSLIFVREVEFLLSDQIYKYNSSHHRKVDRNNCNEWEGCTHLPQSARGSDRLTTRTRELDVRETSRLYFVPHTHWDEPLSRSSIVPHIHWHEPTDTPLQRIVECLRGWLLLLQRRAVSNINYVLRSSL